MRHAALLLILFAAPGLAGCMSPNGATAAERRSDVLRMQEYSMAELYERRPETRWQVENAVGYGVFNNIETSLLLVGTGNGYGVVENLATGEHTYMRMLKAHVGLGFGIKNFRAVFIFYDPDVLSEFIHDGWDFGATADAAVRLGDGGGSVGAASTATEGMDVYQFTEEGVYLRAAISGARFWGDDDLN